MSSITNLKLNCTRCMLIICLLNLLFSQPTYAWFSAGHRLVAIIAYDQLTKDERKYYDGLIKVLAPYYRDKYFDFAATWPDYIKRHDVRAFNSWHYINLPYRRDDTKALTVDSHNVVWAIGQSQLVLHSKKSNRFEKAFFLRYLIHCVGDIHQPLHDIDLYSKRFPKGDKGGVLFLIDNKKYDNLHAYWDAALGKLKPAMKYKELKKYAAKLEKKYPKKIFARLLVEDEASEWAQEGLQYAKRYVYTLSPGDKPSKQYIKRGRAHCDKQLALAGYRLAKILKQK